MSLLSPENIQYPESFIKSRINEIKGIGTLCITYRKKIAAIEED